MKMKNRAVVALMGLGMLAAPAIAQADGLTDKLNNLQISGFVDASYSDTNAVGTQGGITLDQVELDIEYSSGNVGLRFDLESTGDGFGASPFEQGYIYYTIPGVADDGLTFTFGKFNAPIGWELLDAPDMYQFSHALVFDNGLPTNLVGASLSASVADGMADLIVYVANGAEINAANSPANTLANGSKGMNTWGGRLGVTPTEGVNVGFSFFQGDNINGTFLPKKFTTIDIDLTLELVDNLIIGAEWNSTKNWVAQGVKADGWFVTGHYDFTDSLGATLRYGNYDFDKSLGGSNTAITGALTAALGDGLGALIEVRKHKNTALATNAGLAGDTSETSYAFEMTYGF